MTLTISLSLSLSPSLSLSLSLSLYRSLSLSIALSLSLYRSRPTLSACKASGSVGCPKAGVDLPEAAGDFEKENGGVDDGVA